MISHRVAYQFGITLRAEDIHNLVFVEVGAARMIKARSETAGTKPAFSDALKSRRCLISADGEWMRAGKQNSPTASR
jgi:putative SOS response-associated peptidase YedK